MAFGLLNIPDTESGYYNMNIPSQSGTLTYNGANQTPAWNYYDANKMTLSITAQKNAGTYSATFTPIDPYIWSDGTVTPKTVQWSIGRAAIPTVPSQSGTLTYTGSAQSPSWSNYDSAKMTLGGTSSGTNAGSYNAQFTPTANYKWSDGSIGAKTVSWSIGKAAGSLSLSPTNITLNESTLTKTIMVTRAGNGAVTAKSSNINVATVSVSGTTITVTHVNQTPGSATITVSVAAGTNHTAPANKTCAVTASFLPVKAALNSMSWADINTIAQARKAAEYWSIGDTKTITLSTGEKITVRIEDFNHDTLSSGGKAPITFGMVDCLNEKRIMNTLDTSVETGGWETCEMRSFMTTFLGQLPSDLQAVIKSVKKLTGAMYHGISPTTTIDKLWLFSYTEVNIPPVITGFSPDCEGAAYPLFISNASRIKKVNGSANYWWLRTSQDSKARNYIDVKSDGSHAHNSTNNSFGVAVGFCL